MFCRNCGHEIDDKADVCIHCGVATHEIRQRPAVYDSGSIGWAVLAFFIPLVGFILWLAWMDVKPKCSKMAGRGLLTLIAFVVITIIITAAIGSILS